LHLQHYHFCNLHYDYKKNSLLSFPHSLTHSSDTPQKLVSSLWCFFISSLWPFIFINKKEYKNSKMI
jgi:hypothetical protein